MVICVVEIMVCEDWELLEFDVKLVGVFESVLKKIVVMLNIVL